MIKRLIRNIRQKPKAIKDNIALGIAGVFTAIVGSFWLYNFPTTHSLQIATEADETAGFSGLFSDFKDQMATLKESAQESSNQQATGTPESSIFREQIDIKEFYPPVLNATNPTTTLDDTASTTPFGFSTESAATGTEQNTVTDGYNSQPTESSRPIRIVTTNNAASTSASTTSGQ
jgi:hypothetical protein